MVNTVFSSISIYTHLTFSQLKLIKRVNGTKNLIISFVNFKCKCSDTVEHIL